MSKKGKAIAFSLISLFCCALIAYGALSFSSEKAYKKVFPIQFEETVDEMCKETGLSKSFVYAVIKTESNFDKDAVSPAGAKGLMQLMPASFEWIQQIEHAEVIYGEEELFDPKINIKYGCLLLKFFCDRYSDEYTAAAAYNAGPGNVDEWLSNGEYSEDGKTLSNIPFGETKMYVQTIKNSREKYIELYDFN